MKEVKKIDYNLLKDRIEMLDDGKQSICLGLLKELTFMNETLEKLKTDIEEKGTTCLMCQGKYDIERANPSLSSYNTMIKNYTTTSKQLFELLPKEDTTSDDFDDDDLT